MEQFIKKPNAENADEDRLTFSDDELIQIYNALGYTKASLVLCNGVLQDTDVCYLVEDSNRFINSICCKIESYLSR